MSLFGSLMPGFDDDPFFGGHRTMMRQMDEMMSAMTADPFMGMNRGFPPMLAPPPLQQALLPTHPSMRGIPGPLRRQSDPFSAFGMPGMNIFQSMEQLGQGGNCHSFSSSSMMTMTTGPDGKPMIYQESSSTRAAPDGVKETRRTVSDSMSGKRSMAIGHHINDRAHVIEKEQNREGELEERQEFINLDEEDAQRFDAEFRCRINPAASIEYQPRYRGNTHDHHRSVPALTSSSYRRRSRPQLAITSGSSYEDRQRRRDREERTGRGSHRYNPAM